MITNWTDITTADVNDIVCDCSAESGLQITAREVLAVLQQAGFQSKQMNHGKTRGWIVRERGLEEVNANRNIEGRS